MQLAGSKKAGSQLSSSSSSSLQDKHLCLRLCSCMQGACSKARQVVHTVCNMLAVN
jgi:hypothetical protein